jgi:hypothetical protein
MTALSLARLRLKLIRDIHSPLTTVRTVEPTIQEDFLEIDKVGMIGGNRGRDESDDHWNRSTRNSSLTKWARFG